MKLTVDVGKKGAERKETAYSLLLGGHFLSEAVVRWPGTGISTLETRKCLLLVEEQE